MSVDQVRKAKYDKWYHKTHPEKLRARKARYQKKYPDRVKLQNKNTQLKFYYGIDLKDYLRLLKLQKNKCGICKTIKPGGSHTYFCVDHDHKSGRVRGLLCHTCNFMLGKAKDDIDILKQAVRYLRRSK